MKTYKHLFSVPETYKLISTFCCATRVADVCETQLDYILVDVDPVLVAFSDDHVETSSVFVNGCRAGPCFKLDKKIFRISSLDWFLGPFSQSQDLDFFSFL